MLSVFFFFSSRRRHTRFKCDWSSDVCSSDLEVQRIKGEGDYDAARALFETYGVHFDPALRDEIVARVDHLRLPSYTAFVMPKLEAVTNQAGEIADVTIS